MPLLVSIVLSNLDNLTLYFPVGGPEISNGDDQPLVIGKAAGSGNNLLSLDHFQYISNSAQPHPPHLNIMN